MVPPLTKLPPTLLLLVHLHLLGYPHVGNPEYDRNLFNSTSHGLRDRTKNMQDVCYFLVEFIEGGRSQAKTILPSYPCLQPSDTTAFRLSLSKYIETLRHRSLHSAKQPPQARRPAKGEESSSEQGIAWWWKDVIVRKSLLEECSGDRFERLALALSTHAVWKAAAASPVDEGNSQTLLSTQTNEYATLLAIAQSTRRKWETKALHLLHRQADLKLIQERITSSGDVSQSRYDILSTERLRALCASRRQDLLSGHWSNPEGERALTTLTVVTFFLLLIT
ncbi:hypothetical protein JAAARDRAFT_41556 [Jaapia argillacea MUCL 33604]|uniref:HAUS augmin-like complex subunit 6 N-terminal domain-containing protein n=1 Tax=Jaapia argillacea MUCL 33604 TaxID=933084 RepID=A0A067PB76_9AGAM|nr:hypothetical protein JAAARDRAFT_41556 [Jaapia argillacea MUCL 33604]